VKERRYRNRIKFTFHPEYKRKWEVIKEIMFSHRWKHSNKEQKCLKLHLRSQLQHHTHRNPASRNQNTDIHTHRDRLHKTVSLSSAALIYTARTNSISLHADHAHSPGSFHCHYRCCCFKQRLNERPEEDKF